MDIWKISSLYGDCTRSQMCHDKTTCWLKTDPSNKFLNSENRLIVFSSSSSTHRHTSTRSCYNIYSRLWGLSVPTFRIFEDFRGFWLGTSNIYPGCPAKNILEFPMKIFFSKNQNSVTVVLRGIEFQVVLPWQNFRKLSQFSINGRIWLTFRLCLVVQYVIAPVEAPLKSAVWRSKIVIFHTCTTFFWNFLVASCRFGGPGPFPPCLMGRYYNISIRNYSSSLDRHFKL